MTPPTEIAIVGGGVIGAACACALSPRLRVRLYERAPVPETVVPETVADAAAVGDPARVYAVNDASLRILRTLGAAVPVEALRPIRRMRVWDGTGGEIRFTAEEVGADALGYIVEHAALHGALWRRLRQLPNLQVTAGAELVRLENAAADVRLEFADGTSMAATLAVGADGAQSKLRDLAGIPTRGHAYGQGALIATVASESALPDTALQVFLPGGPLALLPYGERCWSIVWSLPESAAARLTVCDTAIFDAALTDALGGLLGRLQVQGRRAQFPLRLAHAVHYSTGRVALIGDAAHQVHPLAGQGVNLGLLDAAALAQLVNAAHEAGRDVGASGVLRRYARWRKGENLPMVAGLDGLHRLFASRNAPMNALRALGLSWTDRLSPVKRLLMRRAMGRAGELPTAALIRDFPLES